MRQGSWSRLRAALRLARRQVQRAPGTSTLVLALIALPVAALTGAAVFWQSQQPSPSQQADVELGQAQSWLARGAGDPRMRQYVDQPNMLYLVSDAPPTATPAMVEADVPAEIPEGSRVLPVAETATAVLTTPHGARPVDTTVGEVWDPVLAGRYLLLEGHAPASEGEVMVSPGLLDRLGVRLGDRIELRGASEPVTVTGLLRRADQDPDQDMLFLSPSARQLVGADWSKWYVADWQPSAADLDGLNDRGVVAYARDAVLSPPPGARLARSSASAQWMGAIVIAAASVFGGYLTVLLAGAALSVSTRRQQRTLAVAASVGASRGDVFRIVLLEGAVLGLAGGVIGAVVGVGLAAVALAATDRGIAGAILGGNWGFQVPWAILAAVILSAIGAGTVAAMAPARAASRGDTIAALRGARRPGRIRARLPLWGLVLMVAGIALGLAGGAILATIPQTDPQGGAARTAALWVIVLGPVLVQIGVILAGHWLLTLVARTLAPVGLGARLASRDAAANPSRMVPAFAAIAACVFLASFALSATAMSAAATARGYDPQSPIGTLQVMMWANDTAELDALLPTARDLAQSAAPAVTATVWQPAPATYTPLGEPRDPDFLQFRAAENTATCRPGCVGAPAQNGFILVVAPDEVATVLGAEPDPDAREILRRGGALTLNPGYLFADATVRISTWHTDDLETSMRDGDLSVHPVETVALPAASVNRASAGAMVLVTPETARALGMVLVPRSIVAAFDRAPDPAVLDRLRSDATVASLSEQPASAGLSVWFERGPQPADPWLWLLSAVTAVLVIGASTVSLGLSRVERRPDDATLAAIGAGPGLRRRVNAWQALVVVGIGSIVGAAAGALPMQGIAMDGGSALSGADTPWPWLLGIAVALPLAIAGVSWLVTPRRPDLTRRTVIA